MRVDAAEEMWGAVHGAIGETAPLPESARWRWVRWLVIPLGAVIAGVALYFAVIPYGASPLPWLIARTKGPTLTSPRGGSVRVYYNDAGAMHSGNHWTWVVGPGFLGFRRVVLEGYVDSSVAVQGSVFPAAWTQDGRLRVTFLAGRRAGETVDREWTP